MAVPEIDPGCKDFYLLDTGERLRRVTSALDAIGSEGLKIWAAQLAAKMAFDELPALISGSRREPCGRSYSRCHHEFGDTCERCPCGVCEACLVKAMSSKHASEAARRADEGSRVHAVIEDWILTGRIGRHDNDIRGYVRSFEDLVADFKLEPEDFLMAEATVINRAVGYAGTADGVVELKPRTVKAATVIAAIHSRAERMRLGRLDDKTIGLTAAEAKSNAMNATVIIDWKTREKTTPVFYDKYALQSAAYANAEMVVVKQVGEEAQMPITQGGVIVQFNPEKYALRVVDNGARTFEAFKQLWTFTGWLREHGAASVSSRTFTPKSPTAVKAAAKAATGATSDVNASRLTKPPPAKRTTKAAPKKAAPVKKERVYYRQEDPEERRSRTARTVEPPPPPAPRVELDGKSRILGIANQDPEENIPF